MQVPLVGTNTNKETTVKLNDINDIMVMTTPSTKDLYRNKPLGSKIDRRNSKSLDEGFIRPKSLNTAIAMARMITNNRSFNSSMVDEGSECGRHAEGELLKEIEDYNNDDYDGDSITDYDGTDLDIESNHQQHGKKVLPPPSLEAPMTHHVEFDPVNFGREDSNSNTKASEEEQSSSGKNSVTSFSDKTSGESSSKRRRAKKASDSKVKNIVRKETRKIKRWKLVAISTVCAVGLVASAWTFWITYQKYDILRKDMLGQGRKDDPFFYKSVFDFEETAVQSFRESVERLEDISRALTEENNRISVTMNNNTQTIGEPKPSFPFVTLPRFSEMAREMSEERKITGSHGIEFFQRIFWAPLIDPLLLEDWEKYTLYHQGWIVDTVSEERHEGEHHHGMEHNEGHSLDAQTATGDESENEDEFFDPNKNPLPNFSPAIHSNLLRPEQDLKIRGKKRYQFSPDANAFTYLPAWQTVDFLHNIYSNYSNYTSQEELPTVCNPNFINFDLFTWFTKAAKDVRDARDIALDDDDSAIVNSLSDGTVHAWVDKAFDDIHHNHDHEDRIDCDTTMFLRVPVYDSFQTPNTVGYVFAALDEEIGFLRESAIKSGLEGFPFRLVIKEERNGRPIVAKKRTYEINGSKVTFIGDREDYDEQYDDMFYEFKLKLESEGSTSSTLFTVYPTEKFFKTLNAGTKKSNGPMSMSIGYNYPAVPAVWTASLVASVFAVILIVFVCYDNSVEDRQRKLLRQAERTDAIVGSMFPANIQGRLMMIDDDTIESSQKNRVALKQEAAPKQNDGFPQILKGFDSSQHSLAAATELDIKVAAPINNSSIHTTTDSNTSNPKPTALLSRMGRKPGNWNRNQLPMPSPQASLEMKVAPSAIDESLLRFGNSKPMADFYPNTTILMCDIAGFTAWSSARAPADVFRLLETIYGAFDDIARAEKVFKVETVGDCYVACAGLPVKQPKHAVIIAKFAKKTLKRYDTLIKKLETYLGPDTVDLGLRIGIHSGPVTAGVLRGDKTRFQLFGDTVNTASRMESTGRVNMIQVSPQTANLLKEEGFGKWVIPREHLVEVKGKGMMQTYWLLRSGTTMGSSAMSQTGSLSSSISSPKLAKGGALFKGTQRRNSMGASNASWETSSTGTQSSGSVQSHPQRRHSNNENAARNSKERRLIEWMVETFMKSLKKIATHRARKKVTLEKEEYLNGKELSFDVLHPEAQIIEEIKEVIPIQRKESLTNGTIDADERNLSLEGSAHVTIPRVVERQLRDFITVVSLLYHDHAFHNFEHCAHVLMSVSKLLSRILESKLSAGDSGFCRDDAYGITSDPLLEFSCIFSALIHDVDHSGVPNSQLVKESTTTAIRYHNRSVAEQHSIAVAWSLLMQPCYRELRECIYRTRREFDRFRQLVVNSVMATDIMNGDLKKFRDNRWEKAFNLKNDFDGIGKCTENANRMATVVIEHMIQASDVAHTMQHWHVYLKFNERLFKENYQAFKDGRAEKDPSDYWYEGELNFFKFYIIPLALKLKECGVFGVSGDEYFFHAESNRSEWALKGREIVDGYMGRASRDSSRNSSRSNSPNPLLANQLLKLPEGKVSSFRGDRGKNPLD